MLLRGGGEEEVEGDGRESGRQIGFSRDGSQVSFGGANVHLRIGGDDENEDEDEEEDDDGPEEWEL